MLIRSVPLWLAVTNAYLVATGPGEPAVLVDAPPDPEGLEELVEETGVVPVGVLTTHGHVDHAGGLAHVQRRYGATAYAHPDDDFLTLRPADQLRMLFGMGASDDIASPENVVALDHGQALDLAGMSFEVIHTPGHSPGHVCFRIESEGVLFSGDQLFAGSIGRTDLPGGDYATLMRSMIDRVVTLPPETDVLPGHGPATTIARELASNPFLADLPRE